MEFGWNVGNFIDIETDAVQTNQWIKLFDCLN